MTRMQGLRESFRVLGTVVRFTRWSTPIGLPAIRQELVRAVRPGEEPTTAAVTERSIQAHGPPTPEGVAEARRILTSPTGEQPGEPVSDKHVADAMKAALARLGIDGGSVIWPIARPPACR